MLFLLVVPFWCVAQFEKEDAEFKTYLKDYINLEDLKQNPILGYRQSDSIIQSISIEQDSLFNARFYHLLGKLNADKGNTGIAIEYFNIAEDYFNQHGSSSSFFIYNYLDRGNLYYKSKNFERALMDYEAAKELAERMSDQYALSTTYNNMGLMDLQENKMTSALKHFEAALEIRQKMADDFLIGHSFGHIAMFHFHNGNYAEAIKHYSNALDLLKKLNETEYPKLKAEIARLHNDMGYACYKQGQNQMARKSARIALDYASKIASVRAKLNLNYQSARVLYFSEYFEEAIEIGHMIREDARDENYSDVLLNANQLLTDCFEKMEMYDKAIVFARQSQEIKERISKEQLDKQLANERFSFQTMSNRKLLQMIEKENRLKSRELEAQERVTQLLFLLIFISILGLIVLGYSIHNKNQTNKKLLATNQLIETQNAEIKKQQTALKAAKAELEDKISELENLTGEKSHLLSIVAHDLRTPLNSILGLCDLIEMEKGEGNEGSIQQYLDLIKESGNRMLGMINTLLNVRKIEEQNIEVNFVSVGVMQTINKVLSDFASWAERKSIVVEVGHIDVIQTVYSDEVLFRQVIENLISNAIKYSPFKSKIEISGEVSREGFFMIHVTDFGPGISKEDQKQLFGKYQRLSARPTAGEDSVGIGLSLVKKLTELMNGRVLVKSELGTGSTFSIEFPVKRIA